MSVLVLTDTDRHFVLRYRSSYVSISWFSQYVLKNYGIPALSMLCSSISSLFSRTFPLYMGPLAIYDSISMLFDARTSAVWLIFSRNLTPAEIWLDYTPNERGREDAARERRY